LILIIDKEEAEHNHSFIVQPSRQREHLAEMWKRRSLDIPFYCNMSDDGGEAETPAPPPSPEFSTYSGSLHPTPCHTRQQLCNSLSGTAEEEGCADEVDMKSTPVHLSFFPRYSDMGQFNEWKNAHTLSYSSGRWNESLSILSKMDDSLVEETARLSLVPVVARRETVRACATDKAFAGKTQQMLDEDRKTRDILIGKMEQHDALTQQLRSIKKECTGVPDVFKKPLSSEASGDDIMNLNNVEKDFSLDEDGPDSPEVEALNDDSLEVASSEFESSSENIQPLIPDTPATADKSESCHFSRLTSESDFITSVVKTEGNHGMLSKSIFLGDLECQYGAQKVDEALAVLGCLSSDVGIAHNHELDDTSFSAPARPPSPEFDIKIPEQRELVPCDISCNNTLAEYSLISEADDCSEASLRDSGKEERNENCVDVRNDVMVSADEDGGFLSVLSEAALYHATLKHTSDMASHVRLAANSDMCSQNVLEEFHSAAASTAVQCVHEECDDVQKQEHSCEASSEFVQEGQEQEESLGMDLKSKCVYGNSDNSLSVIHECPALDGSLVGSCIREMDATSDLNECDRKNMEDMKNLESEEGFNDTLEEMEMLLKFGIDYMMSGNDVVCSEATDKQSVCHTVSTTKKSLSEMSEIEDFGIEIHVTKGVETPSEDYTESCRKHEVCASDLLNKNSLSSSQRVACDGVEIVSTSEMDCISFPKPATPLGKFHNKLQAVASATLNLKSDKPSPFRVPVKPVFHGTHIPKVGPGRSAMKSLLKPITVASPSKRPLDYSKVMSPVRAYIHNTPPPLVTTIKPKLCHAATPKRVAVGKGATVMPKHEPISGIEKTHLEVSINLRVLTD
jgi:hypothetical protein